VDIRSEFSSIMSDFEGIARWLLLRKFTDEKSPYWNDITKEAIGGPKYEYNDFLIEGYSIPAVSGTVSKREGVVVTSPGDLDITSEIFYLKHNVPVVVDDEIYDLDWEHTERPTIVYDKSDENLADGKVCPKRKYSVKRVDPKRGDLGRIEFKKVFTVRDMIT